jgi:hypothetical protein
VETTKEVVETTTEVAVEDITTTREVETKATISKTMVETPTTEAEEAEVATVSMKVAEARFIRAVEVATAGTLKISLRKETKNIIEEDKVAVAIKGGAVEDTRKISMTTRTVVSSNSTEEAAEGIRPVATIRDLLALHRLDLIEAKTKASKREAATIMASSSGSTLSQLRHHQQLESKESEILGFLLFHNEFNA